MKLHTTPFLGIDPVFRNIQTSAITILPFPYEGGVSYGRGTAKAPQAILQASQYVELYDEVLQAEPFRAGITTLAAPEIPTPPEQMLKTMFSVSESILKTDNFPVVIGGDHSISTGLVQALLKKYDSLSVIQLDAHADLRSTYEGSPLSHACVMSKIREMTTDTLQLGIRSLSVKEAERIRKEEIDVCTMHAFRQGKFDWKSVLDRLPDPVFITLDVDVFDWSVIRTTGTPEPGGFLWDEALYLLQTIFQKKQVVAFDIVELGYSDNDINSSFAAARLIYKMIGFKLSGVLKHWPETPQGPL